MTPLQILKTEWPGEWRADERATVHIIFMAKGLPMLAIERDRPVGSLWVDDYSRGVQHVYSPTLAQTIRALRAAWEAIKS